MATNVSPNDHTGPECEACGRRVSRAYARVFGDNEGRVEGCLHCSTLGDRNQTAF